MLHCGKLPAMDASTDIFSVMTVPAEAVSPAEAEAVAREHWGIRGKATLLTGERDRNFRLTAAHGAEYVLKFANPAEDPTVTDLQIKALQHIAARDPAFPVPRVVPLPSGAVEVALPGSSGPPQRVRLLTFLQGTPMRQVTRTPALRDACGRTLARLGLALADFRHPAARHPLIWDLAHFPRLREVMWALEHAEAREIVEAVFEAYDMRVRPVLSSLRHQVLHNDMNSGNTLVDARAPDRIAGIIDFGDMVETALVIDVAVAAAHHIRDLGPFVSGFHAVRPLHAEEVSVLQTLIAARQCMSLVLRAWHRSLHPENPHYAPLELPEIRQRLAEIAATRATETEATLRRACGLA
jgi:hydroxylysine kinase